MKGNLLIIDDEALLVKNMQNILEDYADEIFTAGNGKEALDIFRRETIHCIVCDINMPVMNGVEFIKRVREDMSDVPFIFYTGHGNRDLMLEAAKYGAFDFLNKPSLDNLEEIVRNALNHCTQGSVTTSDHMSEYLQMLKDLEENSGN